MGDAAGQISSFLKQIKGLAAHTPEELEALLFRRRFDLIPPLKGGRRDKDRLKDGEKRLPQFSNIPSHEVMKKMLLKGLVPYSFQHVGHVVHPDTIKCPWAEQAEREEHEAKLAAEQAAQMLAMGSEKSAGASRAALLKQCVRKAAWAQQLGTDWERRREGKPSKDSAAAGRSGTMPEVKLCGQPLEATCLGKEVPTTSKAAMKAAARKAKEEAEKTRLRQKRKRLEVRLQLEEFEEQRLIQKIEELEERKREEEERQVMLREREARRALRTRELKQAVGAEVLRQIGLEQSSSLKESESRHRQREEREAEKKRQDRRRRMLEDWYARQDEEHVFTIEHARLRREERSLEEASQRSQRESSRVKTLKQIEAEEKVARVQSAFEQRPFQLVRPHDSPRAAQDRLNEPQSARTPRRRGASWISQAKTVSSMYGLTAKDRAGIEEGFACRVRGAGRLARLGPGSR